MTITGTVESFVSWRDPRQVCLLAKAGAVPDSTDPRAARAQVAMPCLRELSKSDLFLDSSEYFQNTRQFAVEHRGTSLDPERGHEDESTSALKHFLPARCQTSWKEGLWCCEMWMKTKDLIKQFTENKEHPHPGKIEIDKTCAR
jgi:hypothetical protein